MHRYVFVLLFVALSAAGLFVSDVEAGASPWSECAISIQGVDPYTTVSVTINGQTVIAQTDSSGNAVLNLPDGVYKDTPAEVQFSSAGHVYASGYRVTATCSSSSGSESDSGASPPPDTTPADGRLNNNPAGLYFYYCTVGGLDIWFFVPEANQGYQVGTIAYSQIASKLATAAKTGQSQMVNISPNPTESLSSWACLSLMDTQVV